MPESAHPNRWFGANPQATASQGKNQHGWTRDTPATWRSALGLSESPQDREPPEGGGYWYPESPKKKGPIIAAIIILALIAIAVGWIIGNNTSSSKSSANLSAQVDPTIAYGGRLFVSFACSACHGMQGKGGPDPSVPVLTSIGSTMNPAQIATIIQDGVPGQAAKSGGTTGPYMPTWRNVMSKQQVAALVAYIDKGLPEVPGAVPQGVPTGQGNVAAGMVLFLNYGCENCHGANGLGGVINPSPDGTIPPLGGKDFNAQFNTDKSISDIITQGSVIGQNPISSMPHWGSIIPPDQVQQLVDYIRTLPGPA
jgi:mono/diheme cytochrome c family protein